MKKTVSVLLSLLLCLLLSAPVLAANEGDVPVVTVPGTSNTHILNAEGQTVVPDDFEIGDFLKDKDAMEPLLKAFARAMLTDRWDAYSRMLVDALSPIWEKAAFAQMGESASTSIRL